MTPRYQDARTTVYTGFYFEIHAGALQWFSPDRLVVQNDGSARADNLGVGFGNGAFTLEGPDLFPPSGRLPEFLDVARAKTERSVRGVVFKMPPDGVDDSKVMAA
jgi:hypothetical protein